MAVHRAPKKKTPSFGRVISRRVSPPPKQTRGIVPLSAGNRQTCTRREDPAGTQPRRRAQHPTKAVGADLTPVISPDTRGRAAPGSRRSQNTPAEHGRNIEQHACLTRKRGSVAMGSPQHSSTGSAPNVATNPPNPDEKYYFQLFFPDPNDPNGKVPVWLGINEDYSVILLSGKQEGGGQQADEYPKPALVQKFEYDGRTYYKLVDTEDAGDYYLSRDSSKNVMFMNCLAAVSWHFDKDKHLCVDFQGCPPGPRGAPSPGEPVTYKLAKDFQNPPSVYCVGTEGEIITGRRQVYQFLTAALVRAS